MDSQGLSLLCIVLRRARVEIVSQSTRHRRPPGGRSSRRLREAEILGGPDSLVCIFWMIGTAGIRVVEDGDHRLSLVSSQEPAGRRHGTSEDPAARVTQAEWERAEAERDRTMRDQTMFIEQLSPSQACALSLVIEVNL